MCTHSKWEICKNDVTGLWATTIDRATGGDILKKKMQAIQGFHIWYKNRDFDLWNF